MIFVDTSALMAFVDIADESHPRARRVFGDLLGREGLVSHNYVVVETISLVQRRGGGDAAVRLVREILPSLSLVWVDEALHDRAVAAWAAGLRRRSSLVDHVSFQVMRDLGIERAFTFDRDFARAGFTMVP